VGQRKSARGASARLGKLTTDLARHLSQAEVDSIVADDSRDTFTLDLLGLE
jgi:hypothetical protein